MACPALAHAAAPAVVEIAPIASAQDAGGGDAQADAVLRAIRAQALIGLDRPREARREIDAALAANPNDVEALRARAQLEEAAGRWRQAAIAWDRVFTLSGDVKARDRRDALKAAHPTEIRATAFFEGAPGDDEQYGARVTAAWRSLTRAEVSALLETREADLDLGVRLDGSQRPLRSDAQKLELAVADALTFGALSARVVASGQGVGGGGEFRHTRGRWSGGLGVGYEEPYWLYSIGVENEATISSVAVSASYSGAQFGARAQVREARFGVADDDDVARSTRAVVGLDLAASPKPTAWRFAYVLDAESFDDVDTRTRPASPGQPAFTYTPLPFADREVHSFGVYKSLGAPERAFATFGGGFRDDRKGAEGAFGSISAEAPVGRAVKLGLRSEYSEVSNRGLDNQSYLFAEVYVKRTF